MWRLRKANEEPPLKYKTHGVHGSFNRWSGFGHHQYTARFWMVSFVASENRASAAVPPSSWPVTYSPIAGPCLNPCPEPPPASHTFSISGCRSIKKSPFEVFSYRSEEHTSELQSQSNLV